MKSELVHHFVAALAGIAVVLSLVAYFRHLQESKLLALYNKRKKGRICGRLYHKSLITALDRKTLNRGWFVSRQCPEYGLQNDMIEEYYQHFHEIPDEKVDFEAAAARVKDLVRDIRENGDRDITIDILHICKDCVDTEEWLASDPKRKRLWDIFWEYNQVKQ